MKVVTVGSATQDIVIHYPNPETVHVTTEQGTRTCIILEKGKKIEVNQLGYYTGGGATNSAVSFAHLGFQATACFNIGNDVQGDFILKQLTPEGIVLNYTKSDTYPTAVSFIIPCPDGDRTVLALRGATQTLTLQDLPHGKKLACYQHLVHHYRKSDLTSSLAPQCILNLL